MLGLKNEEFTQNAFLVHAQAILEVIEIYVQFHCLSLYPNDWLPSLEEDVKIGGGGGTPL